MTRKSLGKGKTVFTCEACGLTYADKAIAEKCEAWCTEHKSCNLEIIRHALQ